MTKTLRLSTELALPIDAVTETIAILGRRGSGKTNTAVVFTEELLDAGLQVLIIDPTDVWWGLKSSADGKSAGYPVVVLGGRHADLPLTGTDGATIADFVIDNPVSVVCSLRQLKSKGEQRRFVTELATRLYARQGEIDQPKPLMVIFDEASLFVPQRFQGDDAAMVGAIQQLVRQGRSSGFGVALIDQRAASVNKDVLTQLELLIAHQTTSPQDRKALKEWAEANDAENNLATFSGALASLPRGTAWVWSPGWLNLFKRVPVRARRTFDSSRTPKAGERILAPQQTAAIDLDALKTKLSATIERAKADDPKALRAQITSLQRELAVARTTFPVADPDAIVRAVDAERAKWAREFKRLVVKDVNGLAAAIDRAKTHVAKADASMGDVLGAFLALDGTLDSKATTEDSRAEVQVGNQTQGTGANHPSVSTAGRSSRAPARPAVTPRPSSSNGSLPKGERIMLTAIAQYPDGAERDQLSILTGYKRSSRDTYIQRLQSAGYVQVVGSEILATDVGFNALGPDFEPLPTGAALREYWLGKLPEGERRILSPLLDAYPDTVARDALDEITGYKRSSRDTYIQRLQSRRLVESVGRGEVRASEMLFDGGR